ncbi:MAG: nucleoside hydrolase [Chitinophagaceae bacterium]|nr:MAG: nucleoside hydrolase [Chitinophagaceae bacterium]
MKSAKLFFSILLFTALGSCLLKSNHVNKPVPIIFDSDIGPDYDDVGAITILHAMQQKGEAKVLATLASNKYEGIAAVLDVFNTYWGEPDIPIGVPKGWAVDMSDPQHWSDTILAKYPHQIDSNDQAPDAVEVYRMVLAAQPDHSVTIVTVGFLTNMGNLLLSKGDSYSPLTGIELVKKKVKLLVSMAGAFPSGKEFNMDHDPKASKEVFENWPTPVIFSGFEIGEHIKTGLPLIHNDSIHRDPAKDVFRINIPLNPMDSAGRMSWDEATTLVAVRGYKPFFTLHPGRVIVNEDGSNSWNDNGKGQYYLVQKGSPEKVAEVINQLMMETPGSVGSPETSGAGAAGR